MEPVHSTVVQKKPYLSTTKNNIGSLLHHLLIGDRLSFICDYREWVYIAGCYRVFCEELKTTIGLQQLQNIYRYEISGMFSAVFEKSTHGSITDIG